MNCALICIIASFFSIIAFAYTLPTNSNAHQNLRLLLDESQNKILDEIVNERAAISFHGLLCGLVLAMACIVMFRAWCSATAVVLVTQSMYYHLSPKRKWMLNSLETREQVDAWLIIYKEMKHSGIMTSLTSAIVYLIVSLLLRVF